MPAQTQPEVRYKYDYQVEVPTANTAANYLQGLFTHVDRVALQQPDCNHGASCTCKHAPHLCPVHVSAAAAPASSCTCQYQPNACPLHSLDSGEENADVLRFDMTKPDVNIRHKRDLKETLESMKTKRQINFSEISDRLNDKILELHSKKEELINKIKQKRSQRSRMDLTDLANKADLARQNFLDGVRANFDGLNRSRRETEQAKPVADAQTAEQKQVRNEEIICPTIESLKKSGKMSQNPDVLQYLPEVQHSGADVARSRKHCDECEKMLNMNPCRLCNGASKSYHPAQSQYYEYVEGQPVSYIPGIEQHHVPMEHARGQEHVADPQIRYVYDRYGHKYLESNGNLRLVTPRGQHYMEENLARDPYVGVPNLSALNRILHHNREFIDLNNNHGRMIDEPVVVIRDGLKFIRDMMHKPNPVRESPSLAEIESDEDVGHAREFRPKKDVNKQMYQVVPIMTDDKDGSLLVKIYPAQKRAQRENRMPINTESGRRDDKENELVVENKQLKTAPVIASNANGDGDVPQLQTKPDETKPMRNHVSAQTAASSKNDNKKKYEILTIDGKFESPEDLNEEVDNILRFIYDANERREVQNNDNERKVR